MLLEQERETCLIAQSSSPILEQTRKKNNLKRITENRHDQYFCYLAVIIKTA